MLPSSLAACPLQCFMPVLPNCADITSCCPVVQTWTWGEPWGEFSMKLDRSPRLVEGARDVAKIACGAFHNLLLSRSAADAERKANFLLNPHFRAVAAA